MPFYLIQGVYSQEGSSHLVTHPQRREDVLRETCKELGGQLHFYFFSFGQYDAAMLAELPDNEAAAALAVSAKASGGASTVHTTVLLTTTEAIEAMKKAQNDKFEAPH